LCARLRRDGSIVNMYVVNVYVQCSACRVRRDGSIVNMYLVNMYVQCSAC